MYYKSRGYASLDDKSRGYASLPSSCGIDLFISFKYVTLKMIPNYSVNDSFCG